MLNRQPIERQSVQNTKRAKSGHILILAMASLAITSCGQRQQTSRVFVTNGSEASPDSYPSVVKIMRQESESNPVLCTGTFISSYAILTAAHCNGNQAKPTFDIVWTDYEGNSITGTSDVSEVHPLFANDKRIHPNDLMVIKLLFEGKATPQPSVITSTPVSINQQVTLVGFGNDKNFEQDGNLTGSGDGTKRIGTNKVYTTMRSGLIVVSGDPGGYNTTENTSVTGNGDSGGPLFVDGNLAGITVGGALLKHPSTSKMRAVSYFVDLTKIENLNFVDSQLEE